MPESMLTDPTPASPTLPSAPVNQRSSMKLAGVAGLMLVLGLVIGGGGWYAWSSAHPTVQPVKSVSDKIILPVDAIQIQRCADHKGALYVESKNIPVGPVYMVYNNQVIGIEYMLSKEEFLGGKSFKFLQGLGLKVDHVNIGLLSQGHEGYPIPHYHVDMYTVSQDVEQSITCQAAAPSASQSATPTTTPLSSASATPLATASATPTKAR